MSPRIWPRPLHRAGIWCVLVALVVLGAVFEQTSHARRPVPVPDVSDVAQIGAATFGAPTEARRDRSAPVASALDAASVTWFCGGAPAQDTTLVLTNRAPGPASAILTATTSSGHPVSRTVRVQGRSSRGVAMSFAGKGTLGVIIEALHGGLAASQRVAGGGTATTASCATSSADSWFFAGGDTERGAGEKLVLFNPFADLATADVAFLTPNGFRHPQATQGLAVPGHTVVVVDVAKVQNRRSGLGSTVTTRAGRLVVWRNQTFDGSGPKLSDGSPPHGSSVALGLSAPLTRFTLPGAVAGEGAVPRIILANPGASNSKVRISFAVDDPAKNGQPSADTVDLASGAVKILGADQLRQVGSGVPFSVSGRVLSGGAVVAELWFDGAAPAKGHGSFAAPAFPFATRTWLAPVGLSAPTLDQLGIQSVARAARLRIWVIDGGHRLSVDLPAASRTVPASGRITVDLASALKAHPGAAVEVHSSAPVVVSRLQTGADAHGLVSSPAVAVAGEFVDP